MKEREKKGLSFEQISYACDEAVWVASLMVPSLLSLLTIEEIFGPRTGEEKMAMIGITACSVLCATVAGRRVSPGWPKYSVMSVEDRKRFKSE